MRINRFIRIKGYIAISLLHPSIGNVVSGTGVRLAKKLNERKIHT